MNIQHSQEVDFWGTQRGHPCRCRLFFWSLYTPPTTRTTWTYPSSSCFMPFWVFKMLFSSNCLFFFTLPKQTCSSSPYKLVLHPAVGEPRCDRMLSAFLFPEPHEHTPDVHVLTLPFLSVRVSIRTCICVAGPMTPPSYLYIPVGSVTEGGFSSKCLSSIKLQ